MDRRLKNAPHFETANISSDARAGSTTSTKLQCTG
ncbi:hypothetical protein DAI22_07g134400 [Oryza sativa Japonica Group]|nr:hypothetical protein DAI22_07g134400 [Oryza sativa Japonica Group]